MGDEQPGTGVEPAATGGKRTKQWWDEHPEERERQRERAKALIDAGKLSGKAGYGRRKRRPAYEVSAVKAAVNASKIAEELVRQALNMDREGNQGQGSVTVAQQQKAIEMLFEAEQRVRSERRQEEDHLKNMAGDELTSELLKVLREITGIEEFDEGPDYDVEGESEEVDVIDQAATLES